MGKTQPAAAAKGADVKTEGAAAKPAEKPYNFDLVGRWTEVHRKASCEKNKDGIVRLWGGGGPELEDCKQKCVEEYDNCKAIDFFTDTGWCNIYDAVCKSPETFHSNPSVHKLEERPPKSPGIDCSPWPVCQKRFSTLFDNAAKEAQTDVKHDRPITFITVMTAKDKGLFDVHLGKSQIWKDREKLPHQWLVYNNTGNLNISFIYAQETQKARHNLIAYLHPDVLIPNTWYPEFIAKLAKIEAMDPKWGALGTAGVSSDWKPGKAGWRVKSGITDTFLKYPSGKDNLLMQSFDEHFLMVRRDSPVKFDPNMPGFDLYGSDIALSARKEGLKCYLLNTHLMHKVYDEGGGKYSKKKFNDKIYSSTYKKRVDNTLNYLKQKWSTSGLLPTYGTVFDITVPKKS